MKHLIKRKRKIVHANVSCDYMHTIQMDYVDAIDMWDAARWVGRVRWVEVWVKSLGVGDAREPICNVKRRPNQPPSWFVILDLNVGPQFWSLRWGRT
jgi:hypothetical protein